MSEIFDPLKSLATVQDHITTVISKNREIVGFIKSEKSDLAKDEALIYAYNKNVEELTKTFKLISKEKDEKRRQLLIQKVLERGVQVFRISQRLVRYDLRSHVKYQKFKEDMSDVYKNLFHLGKKLEKDKYTQEVRNAYYEVIKFYREIEKLQKEIVHPYAEIDRDSKNLARIGRHFRNENKDLFSNRKNDEKVLKIIKEFENEQKISENLLGNIYRWLKAVIVNLERIENLEDNEYKKSIDLLVKEVVNLKNIITKAA